MLRTFSSIYRPEDLFKLFFILCDWKSHIEYELYDLHTTSPHTNHIPLPTRQSTPKNQPISLRQSARIQAKVPAHLDANIQRIQLAEVPHYDEIMDPKLRAASEKRFKEIIKLNTQILSSYKPNKPSYNPESIDPIPNDTIRE